jgi:ribosomal protein S19
MSDVPRITVNDLQKRMEAGEDFTLCRKKQKRNAPADKRDIKTSSRATLIILQIFDNYLFVFAGK